MAEFAGVVGVGDAGLFQGAFNSPSGDPDVERPAADRAVLAVLDANDQRPGVYAYTADSDGAVLGHELILGPDGD